MEFFSKIVKMGKRLYVQVPSKNLQDFSPGEPVWVKRIERPPEADDV